MTVVATKTSKKSIEYKTYNKMVKNLKDQLVKDMRDEELKALYVELSHDSNLSYVYDEIINNELKEFYDNIKGLDNISVEDTGYDTDAYYLRLWVTDLEYLKLHYRQMTEFLEDVSNRTGVAICPEFNIYSRIEPQLIPFVADEPKVVAPKFKVMDIELNQDK